MTISLSPGEERRLDVSMTPKAVAAARLYGYVYDAAANTAINGAVVQITGPGGTYQKTTNAQGYYDITGIVPGTYSGTVTHANYETYYI